MKKIIALVLFALLISINNYAQTSNRKYEYAIVYLDEHGSNKMKIYYGNNREENFSEIKKIKLESGNLKNTNNVVDALNYMDEQGYELVNTAFEAAWSMGMGYQYIFRREIKKEVK